MQIYNLCIPHKYLLCYNLKKNTHTFFIFQKYISIIFTHRGQLVPRKCLLNSQQPREKDVQHRYSSRSEKPLLTYPLEMLPKGPVGCMVDHQMETTVSHVCKKTPPVSAAIYIERYPPNAPDNTGKCRGMMIYVAVKTAQYWLTSLVRKLLHVFGMADLIQMQSIVLVGGLNKSQKLPPGTMTTTIDIQIVQGSTTLKKSIIFLINQRTKYSKKISALYDYIGFDVITTLLL